MSGKDQKASVGEGRKRPWWRRKRFLFPVTVLLVLGASYLAWDLSARRALNREIESIRAAGEPVSLEDLRMPDVPDELNAVLPLVEAMEAIQQSDRGSDIVIYGADSPSLVNIYADEVDSVVENNTRFFELVRKARRRERVAWDLSWLESFPVNVAHLGEHRHANRLLAVAAYHAHYSGQDDVAVGRSRDMLAYSEILAEMPVTISYLVSCACLGITHRVLEEITPDLRVGEQRGTARRSDVESLIRELLSAKMQKHLRGALLGERAFAYYNIHRLMGDPPEPELVYNALTGWQKWGLRLPFGKLDAARVIRVFSACSQAAQQDTFPEAYQHLPEYIERSDAWFEQLMFTFSDACLWGNTRVFAQLFEQHYRIVARNRLAATALAMRLYELDHGHRPEKLEDLVPDYLDEIPADPFTHDSSRVKLGEWGGRRLLYSVSVNGKDQGGKYSYEPDEYVDCWTEFDLVFFLDGDRPGEVYDPLADSQTLIHPGETDERDEPRGGTE